jgi:hypothetical protein
VVAAVVFVIAPAQTSQNRRNKGRASQGGLYSLNHSFTLEDSGALWTGAHGGFSGNSFVRTCARLHHFVVTDVSTSNAPGGESAAGEHLKANPRRHERDFVTANFREFFFYVVG